MTDIVERLRAHGDKFPIKNSAEWIDFASLYLVEAAARIERLEAALRKIASNNQQRSNCFCGACIQARAARAALEGK